MKNNKGFSLVELIVVIAIMAILAAVAVIGVSVYIPKAQQASDKQLASDVMYAMTLAMDVGELTDGDYVVIKYDGADFGNNNGGDGATANAAMVAVFGEDWQSELKLVYTDWPKLVVADQTTMGYVNSSSFSPDSMDSLLTKVQGVTDQLCGYVEGGNLNPSAELATYFESMGVDYTTDPRAASNATVLFVGNNISSLEVTDEEFYMAWVASDFSSITDSVSAAAVKYASVLSKAQYLDSLDENNNYVSRLEAAEGTAMISVADTLAIEMRNAEGQEGYYGTFDGGQVDTTSAAYADAMAFKAYMKGMTSAKDDLMEKTNLSNNDYFTDGTVLGYVTNYVNVGNILSELNTENGFVFYYANGEIFSIVG